MNQLRFSLVYQAGIANVFQVESWNLSPFGRNAKRLMQSDFRTCETFARGLAFGGHLVQTFACNLAGEIANSKWSDELEAQPFSEDFRPVIQSKAKQVSPLDALLDSLTENEVVTTREVASELKISTAQAYKLLSSAEQAEKVCKYGYRVKGGWEDPAHSNRKCDSLGWQVIK